MNQPAQYVGGATPNKMTRRLSDIQGLVGAPIEDGWTVDTTEAVRNWQRQNHLSETGQWDITSDGHGFPRNELLEGVSYNRTRSAQFAPLSLIENGYHHVGRTLSEDGDGLTEEEYGYLTESNVPVWYIYYADEGEFLGGEWGGENLAAKAEQLRVKNNLPKKPIYFAVSNFIDPSRYGTVLEALRGAAHIVGFDRVGLLAPYDLVREAFDNQTIRWGAQSFQQSDDRWDPRAHLQEYAVDQWNGDLNLFRASSLEFGQSETHKNLTEAEVIAIASRQIDVASRNEQKEAPLTEIRVRELITEVYNDLSSNVSQLDESKIDAAINKAFAKKFAAS